MKKIYKKFAKEHGISKKKMKNILYKLSLMRECGIDPLSMTTSKTEMEILNLMNCVEATKKINHALSEYNRREGEPEPELPNIIKEEFPIEIPTGRICTNAIKESGRSAFMGRTDWKNVVKERFQTKWLIVSMSDNYHVGGEMFYVSPFLGSDIVKDFMYYWENGDTMTKWRISYGVSKRNEDKIIQEAILNNCTCLRVMLSPVPEHLFDILYEEDRVYTDYVLRDVFYDTCIHQKDNDLITAGMIRKAQFGEVLYLTTTDAYIVNHSSIYGFTEIGDAMVAFEITNGSVYIYSSIEKADELIHSLAQPCCVVCDATALTTDFLPRIKEEESVGITNKVETRLSKTPVSFGESPFNAEINNDEPIKN